MTNGFVPCHRYRHSAALCGNRMYVFGGVDKEHNRFNDVVQLNLDNGGEAGAPYEWTDVFSTGSLPSSRTFHRAAILGEAMYILGGSVLAASPPQRCRSGRADTALGSERSVSCATG